MRAASGKHFFPTLTRTNVRRLVMFACVILAAFRASAKEDVRGVVIDGETNEPMSGASVVLKGQDNKIKEFTFTDEDGKFSISVTSLEGLRLEVGMMNFEKIIIPLDSVTFPIDVRLTSRAVELKEVAVKASRISQQGDTISYNVGTFAQTQDRSIGDVLKRMPGIEMSENGKISYQGEDINKFYIEGSDLLGGKYGIATNGINHDDVGAVEVMENHQPLQVLAGISFSDKAAINLKLKEKAKATWSCHGDVGGGYSTQPEGALWDGELFAMAVYQNHQTISTFRTNNTGENLASSNTDFLAGRRNTGLRRYVGIGLAEEPSLKDRRTLFNRSFLVSANSLWKMGTGEIKSNIDYSFDRTSSMATGVTTYFLDEGNRIVTENTHGIDHEHLLSCKFTYEQNHKKSFVNNTLLADIGWNDISLQTTGTLSNVQSVEQPDYYVSNKYKQIRRFGDKHLVTFESDNEWESLPQTLCVGMNGVQLRQHVSDHAFYTHEKAAYAFAFKGIAISLVGGLKGYMRSMNNQLPELPLELPGITENAVNTNYLTLYATPKLEYWISKVNLSLSLPFSYSRYSFDNVRANRDEVYLSPSLSFNWKPNSRFSGTVRGSIGRSPMDLNHIHPGLIMTNYRTFKAGTEEFYNSSSRQVSASFQYRHIGSGMFANGTIAQSWTHLPYTMAQQLYDDLVVYTYSDADNDARSMLATGSIGKTLDFIHGSCHVNGSFSRSESSLLSQSRSVSSVSESWGVGGKISGSLCSWSGFDCSFRYGDNRLSMNGSHESWLTAMSGEVNLTMTPHSKLDMTIGGEYYNNELASHDYKDVFMLDAKATFRLTRHINLTANVTNLLNTRTYNCMTYSQLTSFESRRQLRGRQLLLSISLKK